MKQDKVINVYMNYEKKVVAAVMPDVRQQLFEETCEKVEKIFNKNLGDFGPMYRPIISMMIVEAIKESNVPIKLKGRAKCNPTDRWNYSTGVYVAKKRLFYKYSCYAVKVLGVITRRMEDTASILVTKYTSLLLHRDNRELDLENLHQILSEEE